MAYRSQKHTVTTDDTTVLRRRIKVRDIPKIRAAFVKEQKGLCPICGRGLKGLTVTLDHCHDTGFLRGALCNNCNGIEGKIANLLGRIDVQKIGEEEILKRWLEWQTRSNEKYIHPNVETSKEKIQRRNKRRREIYKGNK